MSRSEDASTLLEVDVPVESRAIELPAVESRAVPAPPRAVAAHAPALIARIGADLRCVSVARACAELFGANADALVGRHVLALLQAAHGDAVPLQLARVRAGETVAFDFDVAAPGGERRRLHAVGLPDAAGSGFHLVIHDLTAQVRLSRMLEQQALTDALTGLPNRVAWNAELERGLARAARAGLPAAVMFIDLDGFKHVNDRYGHATGDAVLREFAARLCATLRRSDFIARLSGDEFIVLLDRATDAGGNPPAVTRKLLEAMRVPMRVNGHELVVTPSIGLAVQMGPGFDAAALMRSADHAMYSAKRELAQHAPPSAH